MTPDGPRLFLPREFAKELKGYQRHEASGMKALADVGLSSRSEYLPQMEPPTLHC